MKMNYKTFIQIIALIIGVCFEAQSQNTLLNGIVVDVDDIGLQDATVVIVDGSDKITTYCFTGKDGSFSLTLNDTDKKISISYIGYKKIIEDINNELNRSIIRKKYILESDTYLEEIVIKPENIEPDTINLDLGKLNLQENDKLSEILKKNPNFKVDEEGSIIYKGKSIDRILVNGKEFFNYQNSIALDKIENRMISRLQVVNNYRDDFNPDREAPDETVLNIDSREEFKNISTGSVEGGSGIKNKYDFKGSLLRFSSLFNGFLINNTNNIGKPTFKLREIEQLFGNNKSMSLMFAESLNELFYEENKSKNFTSNSNFTFRKQTNNYRINSLVYYINSNRDNEVYTSNSFADGSPISTNEQFLNYKSNTLFSNISVDYLVSKNQQIGMFADINFLTKKKRLETHYNHIDTLPITSYQDLYSHNKTNNSSASSGLNYSNLLSKKILLMIAINYYHENIDLQNRMSNMIRNIDIYRDSYEYVKNNIELNTSLRYKMTQWLNISLKGKYGHNRDNINVPGQHELKRKINDASLNLILSGQKILKKIYYNVTIGYNHLKTNYKGNVKESSLIPFSLRLNYENRLNRFYLDSYYTPLMNSIETGIDILKQSNSLLLGNENIPLNYMKLLNMTIGYSYNNVFMGNTYRISLSYKKYEDQLKEGFEKIDANGIYHYRLFIVSSTEEYKISSFASKTLLKFSSFPVVTDIGLSLSRLKTPIYVSDCFFGSKTDQLTALIQLQSISNYLLNVELEFRYTPSKTNIQEKFLKASYLKGDLKVVLKKKNFNGELGYTFYYDKIISNDYTRQSLILKAEYNYNKLTFGIEGNNIEKLAGIFNNTTYHTRYSISNGINQVSILNESLSYLIFKVKLNY
jgi:hypothetical protein